MDFKITPIATSLDLSLANTDVTHWSQLVYDKVCTEEKLSAEEIMTSVEKMPLTQLVALTRRITSACTTAHFHTCAITNVKSGRCGEDCKWCAQSQHYQGQATVYDVKAPEVCCAEAHKAHSATVEMFSFVASGRRPSNTSLRKLLASLDAVHAQEPIALCASLGLANFEMLKQLKEHGLQRYHCNLESSPRFFPQLCSTHTFEQKIQTLQEAKAAGLELCSGGIIGMGETMQDRLDLALAIRELGIASVPINVLHPIAGTPLQDQAPLSAEEIIRSVALFRLTLPKAALRFAGGRDLMDRTLQEQCIEAGINAAIVGTLLTTSNSEEIYQDICNLKQAHAHFRVNLTEENKLKFQQV